MPICFIPNSNPFNDQTRPVMHAYNMLLNSVSCATQNINQACFDEDLGGCKLKWLQNKSFKVYNFQMKRGLRFSSPLFSVFTHHHITDQLTSSCAIMHTRFIEKFQNIRIPNNQLLQMMYVTQFSFSRELIDDASFKQYPSSFFKGIN